MNDPNNLEGRIWHIAKLLRGPYTTEQLGKVIVPMTVLRRLDCVLAPTKAKVIAEYERIQGETKSGEDLDPRLNEAAGQRFHNHSPFDLARLADGRHSIDHDFKDYLHGFSANVRDIFRAFGLVDELFKMREVQLLHLMVWAFAKLDLYPDSVSGNQFEDLIERLMCYFEGPRSEQSTPADVSRLVVNLLFSPDSDWLATHQKDRKLLDPACGSGGMLTAARRHFLEHQALAKLSVHGQEINSAAYATVASLLVLTDSGESDVSCSNSLTKDRFPDETFDYFVSHPPFGLRWGHWRSEIERQRDSGSRFSVALPRTSDASLLFLQDMWSKRKDFNQQQQGSRLAIVLSASPMFVGDAGQGESEIRRWLIENDWLEAIVALPTHLFSNTSIGAFVWILSNRKETRRRGKIQLIDAHEVWTEDAGKEGPHKVGTKRRHLPLEQIEEIVRLYEIFEESARSKIFANAQFGYTRIAIERPLRLRYQMSTEAKARFLDACPHLLKDVQAIDRELGRESNLDWNGMWERIEALLLSLGSRWKAKEKKLFRWVFTQKDPDATPVRTASQGLEADSALRDFEKVPLGEDIEAFFERTVRPRTPDAWLGNSKDRIGYAIDFDRHFFTPTPPRPLAEIDADLQKAEGEILRLLREVTE